MRIKRYLVSYMQISISAIFIWRSRLALSTAEVAEAAKATAQIASSNQSTKDEQTL